MYVVYFQYFTVPHLFLQESGHSSGIPVESCRNPVIPVESTGIHWNSTGIPLESSRLRLNTVLNSPYCPNLQNYILLSSFLAIFTFI